MIVVPLPIPLDVLGSALEDVPLMSGGLALPVDVALDGGATALEVRLVAALKANADANVTMVLVSIRDDGSAAPIAGTRLVHAQPTWRKLSSLWVRLQPREEILAFSLYGRGVNDFGLMAAPTLLLRAVR